MLNKYDKIINDQLNLKIIEKVNNLDEFMENHYLPHKAVIRGEKEKTKNWMVFDSSCLSAKGGSSLNVILHTEPPLTLLLFGVMCKFRSYNDAIVSDIEKYFSK